MNEYLLEFELAVPDWQQDWIHRQSSPAKYSERDRLTRHYAWAVPTDEAIAAIAALSPIIEIGAGTGYWAMLLAQAGADIVAYDFAPPGGPFTNPYRHQHTWFDIQRGSWEVLEQYPDRALFLCWPPYDDSMAADCLDAYRGNNFAYIGESCGGCNGTDEFFELLHEQWQCEQKIFIPQWDGIHDYLSIYRRKELSP